MASVQAIISSATGFKTLGRVRMMALVENKTVSGQVKKQGYKYEGGTCFYGAGSEQIELLDVTKWNLKWIVSADVPESFPFGCIQTWGCTVGGTAPCTSWDGAAGSFMWGIPIVSENITAPGAVPGFTVTPSSGAINLTWGIVPDPSGLNEVFAYDIYVYDGATLVAGGFADAGQRNVTIGGLTNGKTYTVKIRALSHNTIPGTYSTQSAIPVGATKPYVYNLYTTPAAPTAGASLTINAEIANSGPNGKVRAVFKVDGAQISDQNSTLNTYPGGGLWSPAAPYTMPNKTITITVEAYGWDGTKWVLTDTVSIIRTPSAVQCTNVSLNPMTASIKAGEKETFTATVTPSSTAYDVEFKDRAGTLLGTCKTSGGSCTFIWDSTGKPSGTYYVKAYVAQGSCVSTESSIVVSPALRQWNVNIYARDSVTGTPIAGATVTVGTQSKATDATGLVTFRVDEGTIDVSISKTGYNTFTTVEPVFSDKTVNYTLSPTGIAKGNIHFVSLPVGAGILLDNTDPGVKTPVTVTDIPAGEHTFTLMLAGYNFFQGKVTVIGGSTVEVYVVLTPLTYEKGALYVVSTPVAADVTIDAQPQNVKTPATITNLTAGSHEVKLTKTGYQDLTKTVTITAGNTTYLNVSLTVLPGIGTLEISSTPAGARVFIDGADAQKVTPATITNLSSGDHTYKLVLSGYKDATGTFTIEPGKTTTVTGTLPKKGIGTGTIIGIGLLGAGVLGAVVYFTREKKPEYTLPGYKGG